MTSLDVTEVGGDRDNINTQLTVGGALPDDENIDATYSIGFDIDDHIGTGVTYAGLDGVDRLVYVYATGNIGMGTFMLNGEVEDTVSGLTDPLPETPIFEIEHKLGDVSTPEETGFLFSIPKNLLDFAVTDVPSVVASSDGVDILDTLDKFIFNSDQYLDDPSLTTFDTGVPTPGAPYPFQISGMNPNDAFELYLDDTLVLSDTLDASGNFSGEFVFPIDLSNTELHFLTALDSTAEFAYSFTCPEGGACCDKNQECTDDVIQVDCAGVADTFFPGQTCAEVEPCPPVPRGACCDHVTGECTDDIRINDCTAEKDEWSQDTSCSQIECEPNPIPTVSEWGLIIMALLTLVGGAIAFGRRRARIAVDGE
jgi:hypothetical protein